MELYGDNNERRRHHRKKVKVTALLKMGIHLNGRGYAKDVSIGGMCLVAPGVFQFLKPAQINDYLGAHVRVMFPSQSLTVTCALIRVDHVKGEGALQVVSTSNDSAWEKLCQE
ncbi:MAG TPA: PilZ domain-containing protein [Deltaproteobacteria bacterium]|jgi:hypothetical protein|nr:PilZ domain-containing protein [Deltaproteobacteria bacterium]HOI08069.1 PilZ domain-containing protein [Deltaproteobacteria bacterium]